MATAVKVLVVKMDSGTCEMCFGPTVSTIPLNRCSFMMNSVVRFHFETIRVFNVFLFFYAQE